MSQWRLYICSDCDTDGGVIVLLLPDDWNRESACPVTDFCPGCGSYLSLLDMGPIEVTGTSLVHLRMRTPAAEGDE